MPVRVAVAGAGLIGRRHIDRIVACPATELAGVVDPAAPGAFASLADLFADRRPDAVILATPNRLHADGALACVAAGVPVLVEKPLADTVADGARLVEDAARAGVPLLVGHHRRHSSILATARAVVAGGMLGPLVAVTGTALFRKPDAYFEVGGGWRRRPAAGRCCSTSSTTPTC